jgi:hypothetical protein
VFLATVVLLWIARRDLSARSAHLHAPAAEEMERLRATVEELTSALEERAEAAEKRLNDRIAAAEALAVSAPTSASAAPRISAAESGAKSPNAAPSSNPTKSPVAPPSISLIPSPAAEPPFIVASLVTPTVDSPDRESPGIAQDLPTVDTDRYDSVFALLDAGVTDPLEIAHRTGLMAGEIEVVLRLAPSISTGGTPAPTAAEETTEPPLFAAAEEEPSFETESADLDASPVNLDFTGIQSMPAPPEAPPLQVAPMKTMTVEAASNGAGEKASSATEEDERYAQIYSLVALGISDSTEIARRTGVGRGEVELILSLRARRMQ